MTALSGAQDSWVTSVTVLLFASDADADDFVFVSLTLHADVANTATPATSAATVVGTGWEPPVRSVTWNLLITTSSSPRVRDHVRKRHEPRTSG